MIPGVVTHSSSWGRAVFRIWKYKKAAICSCQLRGLTKTSLEISPLHLTSKCNRPLHWHLLAMWYVDLISWILFLWNASWDAPMDLLRAQLLSFTCSLLVGILFFPYHFSKWCIRVCRGFVFVLVNLKFNISVFHLISCCLPFTVAISCLCMSPSSLWVPNLVILFQMCQDTESVSNHHFPKFAFIITPYFTSLSSVLFNFYFSKI
jgi:hypothetical protein